MARGALKMARESLIANDKKDNLAQKFSHLQPPQTSQEVSTFEPPGVLVACEGLGKHFLTRGQKYFRSTALTYTGWSLDQFQTRQ